MHALRQKCRPKHQLLILKCYPKLPKNTTATEEIKPNGSELSYLLYYASARRSKLTKVGTFLEKKTASDVYKGRTPAVMVTLQILAAFLNSSEVGGGKEGFGLFAPYVLRILKEVLGQGGSVDLVDEALPVWTSVCGHQDHATLAGDGEYRALFAGVVKTWAGFATKNVGQRKSMGKLMHLSASDEIKVRKAGLEAMRAVALSEALNSEPGRQMETVVDVVLQNVWADDAAYLVMLDARERDYAKEKEVTTRGRPSMSTVRTKTSEEGDARAAGGTAADADKIAEEEAGLLALRCLKSIYQVENRGQIRMATSCLLAFVAQLGKRSRQSEKGAHSNPWATALVKMVCNWAPVQDRFVVLFTAVETLIRTPIAEDQLEKQLVLSHIIGQVLASNINLIGLSIMDILLGLVQHVLLVLQIGTQSPVLNAGDITSSDEDLKSGSSEKQLQGQNVHMELVKTASPARVQLLAQLRQCIASLATHVYYTDQISDMVSAILLRLKPSPAAAQHPTIVASAIENPDNAAAEVASNSSLRERPNTDGFFSFDTAREIALHAVKDIMAVANKTNTDGSTTHNSVPINVWEGTQWLLRDPCDDVRRAYVDALCTWLQDETSTTDNQLEDGALPRKHRRENSNGNIARRAVSNASARNRGGRKGHSTFLQLLHLAVYEEALQRAEAADADGEFLLLHLTLATLIEKMGINAVRTGLPMIFRLQEDIQRVASPHAKVRLGSLVHGYLHTLVSVYNLRTTFIGTEIENEIARRKEHHIWLADVQFPPVPCSGIHSRPTSSAAMSAAAASTEALKPFDHRTQLVESLADAYTASMASPPTSPPASPSRSFSLPLLSDPSALQTSTYLKPTPTAAAPGSTRNIPSPILDELNSIWSKEALLSALAAGAPKSLSLSGSRTGGFGLSPNNPNSGSRTEMFKPSAHGLSDHRHLLATANTFPMAKSADGSPTRSGSAGNQGGRAGSVRRAATARSTKSRTRGTNNRLHSRSPGAAGGRRASASTQGNGNGIYRPSSTRTNSIAGVGAIGGSRIDELKRALATGSAALGLAGTNALDFSDEDDDVSGDSMVEDEGEYPESSFGDEYVAPPPVTLSTAAAGAGAVVGNGLSTIPDAEVDDAVTPRPIQDGRNPMDSTAGRSGVHGEEGELATETTAQTGLPMLSLPGTFSLSPDSKAASTTSLAGASATTAGVGTSLGAGTSTSAGAESRPTTARSGFGAVGVGKRDLASLLDSVGLEEGEDEDGGRVTPPY